jgi:uncharacterized protein (TIGR00251 family)
MVAPEASPNTDHYLRVHPEGCSLAIRVQPGAKRTVITGIYGEGNRPHLSLAVKAPPVEGRANEVVVAYMSKLLGISRSRISIVHGEHDRFKLLVLRGTTVAAVEAILQTAMGVQA